MDIVSGEKIQELANIYIGIHEDFVYNPVIAKQPHKWQDVHQIPEKWNNPPLLFCYSHRLPDLVKKVHSLQNPCILLFSNSDFNITFQSCKELLESEKVVHMFCQNLLFQHEKVSFLPIGIANRQWVHGDPKHIQSIQRPVQKTNTIFCSFNQSTNLSVRQECLSKMYSIGIENRRFGSQQDYIQSLASHAFSVCPEGNGLDTHRFWESLYVDTVPIVTRSPLTEQIQASGIPCVLIDSWDAFDLNALPDYSTFTFNEQCRYSISLHTFRNKIFQKLAELYSSMNVVLSFIGQMPNYCIECIQQLRLFFNGPVYLIYSTISDSIRTKLDTLNVIYIPYEEVRSQRFDTTSQNKQFCVVDRLQDRKELFKRSYERIYLLDLLMLNYNLTNVWFMEIDILMYCNPNIFTGILQNCPYAYSYHKHDHCSSAILYVRDYSGLQTLLNSLDEYSNGFMSEMVALHSHFQKHPNDTLFPLMYPCNENNNFWKYYSLFHTFIFDGATIGQYLFGVDPIHTNNTIVKYDSSKLEGHIPIWNYGSFCWIKLQEGIYVPFLQKQDGTLYPIANLHIHSKDLASAVSYSKKDTILQL
jgi:hypothetical protein